MSLTRRSATELLSDLNTGKLTAVELMQATLAQIENVNGAVNAIVALRDADTLLAEAAVADKAKMRGPLHGLPIAVKDLADVASHRSPRWTGSSCSARRPSPILIPFARSPSPGRRRWHLRFRWARASRAARRHPLPRWLARGHRA